MVATDIWRNGYTFTDEQGNQITVPVNEIRNIRKALDASYGYDSLEWALEAAEEDIAWTEDNEDNAEYLQEMQKKVETIKRIMEDSNACLDVWERYWEALTYDVGGEIEADVVNDYIERYNEN